MRHPRIFALGAILACAAATPAPTASPRPVEPDSASGIELRAEAFAAGDSVRYVVQFTVPDVDSTVAKWQLGGQLQTHVRRRPWVNPVVDTARFAAPPLSPGGSSATGTLAIQTFRLGVGSVGVTRNFTATRAAPSSPPDIGALVFVDSAVAYP